MNFSPKSCKKWLISWKIIKHRRSNENWQLFEQTIMFRHLDELFGKKLQKLARFMKNHEKWSIWHKLFEETITFRGFDELFWKNMQKVAHFVKNGEKSAIWPKPTTFQANYHVSRFPWNFSTEVGKSGSFREKPWKIIDLAKTGKFSRKLSPFKVSMNFSEKKISKSGSFHEKPWDSIDLAKSGNFSSKLLPFEVSMNFSEKGSKSGSFREKSSKIIDLTKTGTFSRKLSRFEVLMNFSLKSCKKWLILWKISKKHRFGQNWQLFEQTMTFRGFDELFAKKLQKVAHFVKNHQTSSI